MNASLCRMFAEMDAVSTLWEVIDVCVMMDIKLARPGKNVSVRFLFLRNQNPESCVKECFVW